MNNNKAVYSFEDNAQREEKARDKSLELQLDRRFITQLFINRVTGALESMEIRQVEEHPRTCTLFHLALLIHSTCIDSALIG